MVYNIEEERRKDETKMTHENLVNLYNANAYTHAYILAYTEKGKVYGARIENAKDLILSVTYTDISSAKSGGHSVSLRYRPNRQQIETIKRNAVEILEICTMENLENLYRTERKNRGEIVEKLSAEKFHGKQIGKPNADFRTQGDIQIGSTEYQVKFCKATFTNEKTLANMGIA